MALQDDKTFTRRRFLSVMGLGAGGWLLGRGHGQDKPLYDPYGNPVPTSDQINPAVTPPEHIQQREAEVKRQGAAGAVAGVVGGMTVLHAIDHARNVAHEKELYKPTETERQKYFIDRVREEREQRDKER